MRSVFSRAFGGSDGLTDGFEGSATVFTKKWTRILIAGIIVGLILRFVLGVLFTFNFDSNAWLITSDSIDAYGSIYQANGFWYPPVYGCILAVASVFINLFGMDTGMICYELAGIDRLANVSWTHVISPEYAVMVKSILFFFDLLNAWLIYRMVGKNHDVRKATLAALLWFLCPLVIWSSTIACQIDTVAVTFMLLSVYFLFDRRYFMAGALLSMGFLTKLFPACLAFLFLAYVLSHSYGRRESLKNLVSGVFGAGIVAVVMLVPYAMNGELDSVFSFFLGRMSSVSFGTGNPAGFSPFAFNNIINFIPLVAVAFIAIAWSYYSKSSRKGDDGDGSFITHALMTFLVIFVFSQSLTYPVIMVPLLAMYIIISDRHLMVSYVLLSVISVLYCFSNFHAWLLSSISVFWNVIPIEDVIQMASDLAPSMGVLFRTMSYLGVLPALTAFGLMAYRRFGYAKA